MTYVIFLMRCVACEGSAFFFVFYMQSMQLPKNIPNLHSPRYMKKN